ncbi:hypothetical protein [Actinosynnema sp. NPDC023587]|uniref:hypothetical protein n=1 Tax=Actinosynnema sp. NPDC023587 TaxID=3154695 RepID=UPI0033DA8DF8
MKYDVLQVVGMTLLFISGQGALQLLVGRGGGLLDWLPGGFAAHLAAFLVVGVLGALLARWSHRRAKALGRRGNG